MEMNNKKVVKRIRMNKWDWIWTAGKLVDLLEKTIKYVCVYILIFFTVMGWNFFIGNIENVKVLAGGTTEAYIEAVWIIAVTGGTFLFFVWILCGMFTTNFDNVVDFCLSRIAPWIISGPIFLNIPVKGEAFCSTVLVWLSIKIVRYVFWRIYGFFRRRSINVGYCIGKEKRTGIRYGVRKRLEMVLLKGFNRKLEKWVELQIRSDGTILSRDWEYIEEGSVRRCTGQFDVNKKLLWEDDEIISELNGVSMHIRYGEYEAYCPADGERMKSVGFYVEADNYPDMPLGPTEEYARKICE